MVNQMQARARADLFNSGDTPNIKQAERLINLAAGEGKYKCLAELSEDEAKYLESKGFRTKRVHSGSWHDVSW